MGVPKACPGTRREASRVEVEDHPIEYETFEGIIPEGQYGAARSCFGIKAPIMSMASSREITARGQTSSRSGRGESERRWTLVRIRGRDGEKNTG